MITHKQVWSNFAYSYTSPNGVTTYSPGWVTNSKVEYSKDDAILKAITYNNLVNDLGDNPNSYFYLMRYQKMERSHKQLFWAGNILLAGSISAMLYQREINNGHWLVLGSVGLCYSTSFIISKRKKRNLWRAISVYDSSLVDALRR